LPDSAAAPVLIPHPDYKYNNAVFRGYISEGKKHGFCAYRLSRGEIVVIYFFKDMPLAFESTIFYQNGESCSIINEYGFKNGSSNNSNAPGSKTLGVNFDQN
jgi:hypothetical protein